MQGSSGVQRKLPSVHQSHSISGSKGSCPGLSLGGVPVPGTQVLAGSHFLTFSALGVLVVLPPSPGGSSLKNLSRGLLTLGVSASGDLNGTSQFWGSLLLVGSSKSMGMPRVYLSVPLNPSKDFFQGLPGLRGEQGPPGPPGPPGALVSPSFHGSLLPPYCPHSNPDS